MMPLSDADNHRERLKADRKVSINEEKSLDKYDQIIAKTINTHSI